MSVEKRLSTVSYTKSNAQIVTEDNEYDGLQIDPKEIQKYLAEISQQSGCWGRCLPIPFERASGRSWWDPTFDSEILEDQFRQSEISHNRFKFRCALGYILFLSSLWIIYFLISGLITKTDHWQTLCPVLLVLILIIVCIFLTTSTTFYQNHTLPLSLATALLFCLLSLLFVILVPVKYDFTGRRESHIGPVGHFSICIEILLLIYTLIPLRLYMCVIIGMLYSVAFEFLSHFMHDTRYDFPAIMVRLSSHICIHLIGLHILVMMNVRRRNVFMKVGQSLLIRQQLESEKKLKENMIHSLMPKKVAEGLLKDDQSRDIHSLFRPFQINHNQNVSILFADIVGFTKMASMKTPDEVVDILNNLFQKFDILCSSHNCEKISTLGDCYYCVSGCPEETPDHAKNCIDMGLSMISAIHSFKHGVNMRVGVHTGTVLCGIVGTRRFKYDVWSNDVTLANRMESTGKPGMVHVSEKTLSFVKDQYVYEEAEQVFGLKTYFILGRKNERPTSYCSALKTSDKCRTTSLQVMVSPPTSPPSSSPQARPRVLSCDKTPSLTKSNTNFLSPDVCKMKSNSSPNILDVKNDFDKEEEESVKTPTSTASSGRYSIKLKNWKIPKFLRKTDQPKPENDSTLSSSNCDETVTPSGYQQVPTIIETNNTDPMNLSGVDNNSWIDLSQIGDDNRHNSLSVNDPNNVIDVKSYISQSRSDIGAYDYGAELTTFLRCGSYRSQHGRSPSDFPSLFRAGSSRSRRGKSPNFDMMPTERARSATVHSVGTNERHKISLDVPRLPVTEDYSGTVQSVNSRKDSGIKSNSRRSSIQQIENLPQTTENSNQRVSGYYTSSQSTINSLQGNAKSPGPFYDNSVSRQKFPAGPFYDKYGKCIQDLRKQSDRQLIKCVQENCTSKHSYFTNPPLSKVTLFFEDRKMEQEYRANVHSIFKHKDSMPTLANSRYNLYLDVSVSALVFIFISVSLFILYGAASLWIYVFSVSVLLQGIGFSLCSYRFSQFCERVFFCCQRWYRWNAFGAVLVSLPLIAVLTNFSYERIFRTDQMEDYLYSYLLFVSMIHFCNFTQLNCWMKSSLATVFGITFTCFIIQGYNKNQNSVRDYELFMDLFLMLCLVWMLNREFEIGYRLSFHSNFVASRDKLEIQVLKDQADFLIYNIVPEYVANKLKENAKYSEHCNNVGIMFASIVNFNELYDESYLNGREYLRVLNELIGDFDELLTEPEFKSVEKFKTIGSTFMAASGLNLDQRENQRHPNEHLFALMDFALRMQNVVEEFNKNLLQFNLILRIGYNIGDVTAAVIGKTKLYYDIWGDAVNIASRMDSTGINDRIQVGEHCLDILEERYEFEPRGSVYVKGKDHMNVYLLVRERDEHA